MTVKFDKGLDNGQSCRVQIALSGTHEYVSEQLNKILKEIASYGKPTQGITVSSDGIRHIITPVWNGKPF